MTRWTLTDVETGEVWTMPVNPNAMSDVPRVTRNLRHAGSLTDPRLATFESAGDVDTLQWAGVIRTEAHYDKLELWSRKSGEVLVVDHLGRRFTVVMKAFRPEDRRPTPNTPWRLLYTMESLLLGQNEHFVRASVETETAVPLVTGPPSTVVSAGVAIEVDSARAATVPISVLVGTAGEVDAGIALRLPQQVSVGAAAEVDSATALLPPQTLSIGLATESDSAIALLPPQQVSAGMATESDAALNLVVLSYFDAVLADSPAIYYPCQEASGTTLGDASGNARNGVIAGGAVVADTTDGAAPAGVGKHIRLDGSSGHLQLHSGSWFVPGTAGFTLEGWFYVRGIGNWARFFDLATNANTSDYLWARFGSQNKMGAAFQSSGDRDAGPFPSLNAWHHLVLTCTAAGAGKVYVDTTQVATFTVPTLTTTPRTLRYVGRSVYSADAYAPQSVSQIAIYNQVLSAARVTAHFEARLSP